MELASGRMVGDGSGPHIAIVYMELDPEPQRCVVIGLVRKLSCDWLPARRWKQAPKTRSCHMHACHALTILCFACVLLQFAMASVNTVCLRVSAESLPLSFDNEIVESSELRAVIRSNITCMDDVNKWVAEFGKITHTQWNFRTSLPAGEKIICSKTFVCHHSSFMKVAKTENKRGLSKNSECPAIIKVTVKLNTKATRKKDAFIKKGLFGVIVIYNAHTHSLGTGNTLRFLPAEPALKETFMKYFSDGMGIAESCHYHENILELQELSVEVNFASGRTNPTKRTVQNWHDQWRLLNLGPRNGAGLIEKLKEKQNIYAEQGITVMLDETQFAVAVVTPLMRRAHQLKTSHEVVFVDSTSSCDAENHTVTFVLTSCAAGAVPLGILITKGQTYEAYTAAFKLLQEAVVDSFNGFKYPKIFLTDQAKAEINALKTVWPQSKNLLCIFHVSQSVWRWLWDSKHCIPKEERSKLMTDFQTILYSHTILEAEMAFESAQESGKCYQHWQKYLCDHWDIRDQWCLAWRDATSRGHHTNNFSEVAVRLFKDTVLSRVKAYNVIALIDFSCTVLETYYCHRFRQFANSRCSSARLFLQVMLRKTSYLDRCNILQSDMYEFHVPSESDPSLMYNVNIKAGCCSCHTGQFGKFCKHQCAVYKLYDVMPESFPPVTVIDRHSIARLALGDKTPPLSFYEPFLLKKETPEVLETASDLDSAEYERPTSNTEHVPYEDYGSAEISTTNGRRENVDNIINLIKTLHQSFGSSSSGLIRLEERLSNINTPGQWETFLHTAGNSVSLRRRDGVPIRVQPTSLARRSATVTRGSKRLPSGRPAKGETVSKKRKRNLVSNVKCNQPNAKPHGSGH